MKTLQIPELLAPAGNFSKLKIALHFGADAVYLGLKQFSLRSYAGNFTLPELQKAIEYTHSMGKKIYLTLNSMMIDSDFKALSQVLPELNRFKPDAVIVSDPGVIRLIQREAPDLKIHLSTQANTLNREAAAFWKEAGVKRIVLARELSIEQIGELSKNSEVELEVFVHGAICISYSGRCFLSLYMSGRDANRGECTQSCRWRYRVLEETERKGCFFPIEESEEGSYLFNSKDLCALPVLPELLSAGVCSLKLEGRMKSMHYVGVTVDVYRRGLDILKNRGVAGFKELLPDLLLELSRVSNRGFTTNFLTGIPQTNDYNFGDCQIRNPYAFLGEVIGNGGKYLEIKLKNPLRPGDEIEFCDAGFLREFCHVDNIFNSQGEIIDFGRPGETVRLNGNFRTGSGGLVRKI